MDDIQLKPAASGFPIHPSRKEYFDKAQEIREKPHQYKVGNVLVSVIDYTDENKVYLGTKLISKQKNA